MRPLYSSRLQHVEAQPFTAENEHLLQHVGCHYLKLNFLAGKRQAEGSLSLGLWIEVL